jgi:hypothetical protein
VNTWVVQQDGFKGNVRCSSHARRSFYSYSLCRAQTDEHLFDGAAGDLAEAVDALHAHIRYLSLEIEKRGLAAGE